MTPERVNELVRPAQDGDRMPEGGGYRTVEEIERLVAGLSLELLSHGHASAAARWLFTKHYAHVVPSAQAVREMIAEAIEATRDA